MKNNLQVYRLKQNKVIRCLAFPVVNIIRLYRKWFYVFSNESRKVKKYKEKYAGERCFIIGNGPSLNKEDLEMLKGEHCFAANGIYRIFDETEWRPEFYLCVDSTVLKDSLEKIEALPLQNIFLQMEARKYQLDKKNKNIIYINNYYPYLINQYKRVKGIKVSECVEKYFVAGETVTFNAIQFAIYMGFKEIYLLGVDHQYSRRRDSKGNLVVDDNIEDYFDHKPSENYVIQNVETSTMAYQEARNFCDKKGILIKNLTRGGKLEVFERETLENILGYER